jgi:hypothetical protein
LFVLLWGGLGSSCAKGWEEYLMTVGNGPVTWIEECSPIEVIERFSKHDTMPKTMCRWRDGYLWCDWWVL